MRYDLRLPLLSLDKIENNSVFFVPESYNKQLVDTFEGHILVFKEEYRHDMKCDFMVITNQTHFDDLSTVYIHYFRNLINRHVFNTIVNSVVNETDVLIINITNVNNINNDSNNNQWINSSEDSRFNIFSWNKLRNENQNPHIVVDMSKVDSVSDQQDTSPVSTGLARIDEEEVFADSIKENEEPSESHQETNAINIEEFEILGVEDDSVTTEVKIDENNASRNYFWKWW